MNKTEHDLIFSIELHSRDQVKRVSLPDGVGDRLIFEGNLGMLIKVELVEDLMLLINGDHGNMRIELTRKQLEKMLRTK